MPTIKLKDINPVVFNHNVGIGTEAPTSKLVIMDSATPSQADAGALIDIKRGVLNGHDEFGKVGIRMGNNSNFYGIYYGGSVGRLRFTNGNGIEVLTLKDDGNVGIGKTNPSKKLEVDGEISVGNAISITSNSQNKGGKIFLSKGLEGTFSSLIENDSNKFKILSDNGAGTSLTQLYIDHVSGFMGIGTSTPKTKCVISESGLVSLELNPNGSLEDGIKCNKINSRNDSLGISVPLVLNSSKTILEGGFVGVGTQFPSSKLHVYGGSLYVHDVGGAYNDTSVLGYDSSIGLLNLSSYSTLNKNTNIKLETSSGGIPSEKVRIKYNGNVGIGNTDPSTKLDVNGDIKCTTKMHVYGGSLYVHDAGGSNDNTSKLEYISSSGILSLSSYSATSNTQIGLSTCLNGASSEKVNIDHNGNLYLHDGSGSKNNSSILKYNSSSKNLSLSSYSNTDNTSIGLSTCVTGVSSEKVKISHSGLVSMYGTGTAVPSTVASTITVLEVNGMIKGNGVSTTSDYRLKENIAPINDGLDKVLKLNACSFNWKGSETETVGFLAHEVQEIISGCVDGKKDEVDTETNNPIYQSMNSTPIIAVLVSAIQNLNSKVESLERRLTDELNKK